MANKETWKARAKEQERIADELFQELQQRSAELRRIDMILSTAQLPGPTIGAWAQQVRDLLRQLLVERGIVATNPASPAAFADLDQRPGELPARIEGTGEYTFLTPEDEVRFGMGLR